MLYVFLVCIHAVFLVFFSGYGKIYISNLRWLSELRTQSAGWWEGGSSLFSTFMRSFWKICKCMANLRKVSVVEYF